MPLFSSKVSLRRNAVVELALALFFLSAPVFFTGFFAAPFYWAELGIAHRTTGQIDVIAAVLTVLSPILTLSAALLGVSYFLVARNRMVSGLVITLTGVSALFGWLTIDLWTQRFFGAHAQQYVPYLIDAVRAGKAANQMDFAGDSQAIKSAIIDRLLFVAACGAVLLYLLTVVARRIVRQAGESTAARWSIGLMSFIGLLAVATLPIVASASRQSAAALIANQLPFTFVRPGGTVEGSAAVVPSVRIVALLPDPYGNDSGREEIHLRARPNLATDLTGWMVEDRRGMRFALSGLLGGGEIRRFFVSGLEDLFENDGDAIHLLDSTGKVVDSFSYAGSGVHRGSLLTVPESSNPSSTIAEIETKFSERYSAILSGLSPPILGDSDPKIKKYKPNVVYLILESFRFDGLAEMMPKLSAERSNGLELRNHNSGTNTSHLGLFSLLFARSPLFYESSIDSGVRPQVPATYSASGYSTAFYTSGDCTNWRKMGDFLNAKSFDDFRVFNGKNWLAWRGWSDGDLEMAKAIADRLKENINEPKFIAAFFMASHFPYAYPPEYEKYLPVGETSKLFAASGEETPEHLRNRYRNAMLFLDDLLSELLSQIDMKNTIVVITGDHGESIWDDGTLTHGSRSSDIQTRAPVLILGRGISPGAVNQATTHLDIFPTVLHLAAGEHVSVRGIHGRDILDPSSNAKAAQSGDPFLIVPLAVSQPLDLVLVVGGEKMLFKARLDRNDVSAVGMIDQTGFLNGKLAPDGDHGLWNRAIDLISERFQTSN